MNPTKLVHIDLKGAQFKSGPEGFFWQKFCSLVSRWGASGLLIEWEDSVRIPTLASDPSPEFSYDRNQAEWLVDIAHKNNLVVVPLVQTFGHLEFLLKHPSRKCYREIEEFSNCVIAIDANRRDDDVFKLLTSLIDDFVSLSPDCQAIHLGGDEVWHLGSGPKSQSRFRENPDLNICSLYLEHMSKIVEYVVTKYPGKRILIWDDMLRTIPEETLKFSGNILARFVEPVVWQYSSEPARHLPDSLWLKYRTVFQSFWIATAFKGASSSCAQVTPIMLHVSNQLAWMKLLDAKQNSLPNNFCGTILTGWQRFDHFASLCELLPAGIPSLCCCLAALNARNFTDSELSRCSYELGFDLASDLHGNRAEICPTFPGAPVFVMTRRFADLKANYDNYVKSDLWLTWFSDFNLRRGRFSPLQLRLIQSNLETMLNSFHEFVKFAQFSLSEVYLRPVCDEWLGTFAEPILTDLTQKLDKTNSVLNMEH